MNLLHKYTNGNYVVKLYDDGTKVRETECDEFISAFPENIDIKISDKCDAGCAFCHENSTPNGDVAEFDHEFLYSLRPGTELAIGGGNIFENKKLYHFLKWCKTRGIVANITVNQKHLTGSTTEIRGKRFYYTSSNTRKIFDWIDEGEVYGVGISYDGDAEELDRMFDVEIEEEVPMNSKCKGYRMVTSSKYKDNCVIHVINGVHSYDDIMKLANKGYKILILGYKTLRRGETYKEINAEEIQKNQKSIYDNIHEIMRAFRVVSFDNLAIEQLNIRRMFTTDQWEEFYMGDDGDFTMYIDLVKGEFAKNSTSLNRYGLLNTIDEMFDVVKKEE